MLESLYTPKLIMLQPLQLEYTGFAAVYVRLVRDKHPASHGMNPLYQDQ